MFSFLLQKIKPTEILLYVSLNIKKKKKKKEITEIMLKIKHLFVSTNYYLTNCIQVCLLVCVCVCVCVCMYMEYAIKNEHHICICRNVLDVYYSR